MTWQADSECRTVPVDWFYPLVEDEDGELVGDDGTVGADMQLYEEAKAICAVCPVREPCLDHAMANKERFGLWGGLAPIERLRIERKHRRRRLLERRANEGVEDDPEDP